MFVFVRATFIFFSDSQCPEYSQPKAARSFCQAKSHLSTYTSRLATCKKPANVRTSLMYLSAKISQKVFHWRKEYFQVHLYTLSFAFKSKNDAFVFCLKILFWKRQSFSTPSCASHNRQKKKKGLLERKVRSEKKRFHMSTQYTRKPVLKLSSHM